MTLPVMEPNLDAATLKAWALLIDGGPFSSLCWGERMAFDNPESLTLLGALAAWTDRVRLVTTVLIPQLHDPVMLAKALATGDMLSGGRLTVGLGVGGRHEDYRAAGATRHPDDARHGRPRRGDEAGVVRREGDRLDAAGRAAAVQAGGPKLLVGTMGPKTTRHAAGWADGLAGTTLDLDVDKQNELFDVARDAWRQAGNAAPHLATSFWFAHRRRRRTPEAGARASAPLHELDPRRHRRRDGADHRLGRHRRRAASRCCSSSPTSAPTRSSDPDELGHRSGAPRRRHRRGHLTGGDRLEHMTNDRAMPPIVSRADWDRARAALLLREKELIGSRTRSARPAAGCRWWRSPSLMCSIPEPARLCWSISSTAGVN